MALLAVRRGRELPLETGDDAVGQLAGARQIAFPAHAFELIAGSVELLLELLLALELIFIRLPRRRQRRGMLLQFIELLFPAVEALPGCFVGLLQIERAPE